MSLSEYIEALKTYQGFQGDIVCHKVLEPSKAAFAKGNPSLRHDFSPVLESLGVKKLYSHQKKAIDLILGGCHTVISTPTASGKSLVYNLPVIDDLSEDPSSHALYLFPLKALARDQMESLNKLLDLAFFHFKLSCKLSAAVYDGDISSYQKSKIRKQAPNILVSNPEMLHLALLAHHDLWASFFSKLKYIVVDEVHTCRGVMGSNMAWVFRRLLRICDFYGSKPVFIFCSATIANPQGLCCDLTGLDVKVVDEAGAPTGKKDVILMRGLNGAAQTAITLIHSAVPRELRTICYTQSRKITELIAMWASQRSKEVAAKISAYRAGFLPEERRMIEQQLSTGELLSVVSTSALELGIDIGSLDICILVGYPGTIMSTWQRAGRVGRKGRDSALILIAHEDALDQYFIHHPDVFFSMPPEKAIINPENEMILKQHLECAAAELVIRKEEPLLASSQVRQAVNALEKKALLLKSRSADMWFAARKAPHRDVSLRGTGNTFPIFIADTKKSLGDIDRHRSFFETHEGAIYLHRGKTYEVTRFDYEKGVVEARKKDVNYYTRARSSKTTTIMEVLDQKKAGSTRMGYGRLKIIEQVTGYDRKLVSSGKSLGIIPLDLPELTFETQGLWIEIPDDVREKTEQALMHFMGGIHALEHAAIGIMPLLVMTDRNDIGGISIPFHPQTGKAAVFIYDGVPGGLGFCRQAFENADVLLQRTKEAISSCECENGCPCCVHSPKCGSGNRPIDKESALSILKMILGGPVAESFADIRVPDHADASEAQSVKEETTPYDTKQTKAPVRYAVLDIETRRSAKEVGGWHKAHKMGVSCAVLYDSKTDEYLTYLQDDIEKLVRDLNKYDLIIGFNIIGFDYKVLSGLVKSDYHQLPTLDLLLEIKRYLGYRLSLDHLASQTLGEQKSADGLMALEWWQQGEIEKIITYCRQDVKVTRDLYRFGREQHHLLFKNKAGNVVRIPVDFAGS